MAAEPALAGFLPPVAACFATTLGAPTRIPLRAWAEIGAGRTTLVAASTGSGRTLATVLATIDAPLRAAAAGPLPDVATPPLEEPTAETALAPPAA